MTLSIAEAKNQIKDYVDLDNYLTELLTNPRDIITKRQGNKDVGYPTEHGLRKLVSVYLGNVTGRSTQILTSNENFASVVVSIFIEVNNDILSFSGSAECSSKNTDEPFSNYPLSMAETRATCRAYRSALNIKTCSFDEISGKKDTAEETEAIESPDPGSFIKQVIRNNAKNKKVDVDQMSNDLFNKALEELNPQETQQLLNKIKDL